jgi:hypothetical protein
MTRKHAFRPGLNDVLEDRVALSHAGASTVAAIHIPAKPHPAATPVLAQQTLNAVNRSVDSAFSRFSKDYSSELAALNRTGNSAQYTARFDQSVARLRSTLATQAGRVPGGSTTLAVELQQRVDSLVHDLETNKSVSPTQLIKSDQSGAHSDVGTFVHDEVVKGDLSLR